MYFIFVKGLFGIVREEQRYRQDLDRQGQHFLGTMHTEKAFGRREEEGMGVGVQGVAPRPMVFIKWVLLPVKFVTKSVP